MRATFLHGAGDIRIEQIPDAAIEQPTDAVVRVVRSCICGSDLHPYHDRAAGKSSTIGHEFVGVVEDVGAEVATVKKGDFVIAPFAWSDGTCEFCRAGLQTACLHGGFWNNGRGVLGGQAEAVRVPLADGTLVAVPGIAEDSPLLGSLLTLSDVYGTGWHAAVSAGVGQGDTVVVIGDGAVGLLCVLSAKQRGAERIILMGRHAARTDLGRRFGATEVVAERGEEGIARVRDLTPGGLGAARVLEAVGHMPAYEQALGVLRAGGVIARVGLPQYAEAPVVSPLFWLNGSLTGGPAPARAYIEQLLPAVLDGTVEPGLVFDRELPLDDVAEGYREMDERVALKVMLRP